MTHARKIIVVIPTYNERDNLPLIAQALQDLHVDSLSLLIVDDNSPDGTGAVADALVAANPDGVKVLHRSEKNGLGPAYIAGFQCALDLGADFIIQMDADFSHQPKYIPDLIARLETGTDLVIASRFVKGGGVDERWSLYRKWLSWFANSLYVRALLRMPIHDATAGYRIWKRETLIGINLDRIRSNGYVFQVEMAYVAHRLGYRIAEIPIYFPDRALGESKMDFRIQVEAAARVWQVMARHRGLTASMRQPLT